MRKNLFSNGIGVVYRESDTGRLYGITYIDHNTGVVLNGSRLGKEYSANAVVERLANQMAEQGITHLNLQHSPHQHQSQPLHEPQHLHRIQPTTHNSKTSDLISGSTGLFDLPTHSGDDPEEDVFRRRMQQRKKKRGRRM